MTDLKQAAQQALEALEHCCFSDGLVTDKDVAADAILAIKQALEQPEQEPSQWREMVVATLVREGVNKHKARELADHFAAQPEQEPVKLHEAVISAWSLREVYFDEDGEPSMHRSPPAAPEQEPVAYYHPHKGFYWAKPTHIAAPTVVDVPPVPLYVKWKAAERPWQGLTDEERKDALVSVDVETKRLPPGMTAFARALEAKLKELNK